MGWPVVDLWEPLRTGPGPGGEDAGLSWDRIILGLRKTTKAFIENVLQNIIESIVVTDLDGRVVFFNSFSEQMFGYRAKEVLNRHISVLGVRSPDVLGYIRRNEPFSGEVVFRTKAGRPFPGFVRCVPLRDEDDRPIAMVGVSWDLTREKEKERTEREVARLKTFNENVIASLNDGIQIVDASGRVTFANRKIERLLEYGPEELLGVHYSAFMAEDAWTLLDTTAGSSSDPASRGPIETTVLSRSGRKVPVLASASPLVHEDGVVDTVLAVTDLSEIQILKEQLYQTEKMALIGTLSSEVAHEINNPLGGLILAVQMLAEDLQGPPETRPSVAEQLEALGEIENDARRCKWITQKLLDFARSVPEERTLLDFNQVVTDALTLVQRQAELENVTFSRRLAERLPGVRGHANSLQQVVLNLVENARDSMPGGGRIEITTFTLSEEGRWVGLTLRDTGVGIPPDVAHRIFDSFFTTKRRGKGTGLGLAVSKRIVEEHGGRITFDSCPDGGACFRILLPATETDGVRG